MGRWAPPPKLTISEWANNFRFLSSESSAEPGRYSTKKAPYQRGIMDAMSDPRVSRVVFMAGSQIGKSEILNNILGYYIDYDPCPILVMQPTLQMAEAYSKDRIFPMLRDTPVLTRYFNLRSRSGDNTLLHKLFPGGNLTLVGANSPASLASRPKKILAADEIDRFPISAGDEGSPLALARKRLATYKEKKKEIDVSTPTMKGISAIEKEFELSDKRYYHVPCPHCKEHIVLDWNQMDWDDKDFMSARYICQLCDAIIEESHREWMIQEENGAQWIATAPFTGTAGFHINELYSPWRRFWEIVKDYLEIAEDSQKMKVFTNTSLGLPWEEKGESPEHKKIHSRREVFNAQVPKGVLFLTCGVDVQKDRVELQIIGWGRNRERWPIDTRVLNGRPEDPEVWEELDKVLYEQFEHESGSLLMIRAMAIDSGYATTDVYSWARKHPSNRVIVVKGVETQQSILSAAKNIDVRKDGKKINRGLKIWTVGTDLAKSELYGQLKIEKPSESELMESGGKFPSGYIHFPMHFEEDYFIQLTAEALVPRTIRGFTKYVWVKLIPRNEALDTFVYARAAASFCGMDRFKERNWTDLEQSLLDSKPVEQTDPSDQKTEQPVSKKVVLKTKTKVRRKSSWL